MPLVIEVADLNRPVVQPQPKKARAATHDPTKHGLTTIPVELQMEILKHLARPPDVPLGAVPPNEADDVIGHPADYAPVYKANTIALARLSTMSRALSEIVRPLLYETVWVWDIRSLVMLLRSLMNKKALRGLIRHFATAVPPAYLDLPDQVSSKTIEEACKFMFANFATFALSPAERELEFVTTKGVGPQVRNGYNVKNWQPCRAVRLGHKGFWTLESIQASDVPNIAVGLIGCLCPNIETLAVTLQETFIGGSEKHEREYYQLTHAVQKARERGHDVLQKLHTFRVRSGNYRSTVHGPLAHGLRLLPNLKTIEYVGCDSWHAWLAQVPGRVTNIETLRLHLSGASADDLRVCVQKLPNLKVLKVDFVPGAKGPKCYFGHCFLPGVVELPAAVPVSCCQKLEVIDLRWDLTSWDEARRVMPPPRKPEHRDYGRAAFVAPPPVYNMQPRLRAQIGFLGTRPSRGGPVHSPDTTTMDFSRLPRLRHLTLDLHALFGGRDAWLRGRYPPAARQARTVTPLLPPTLRSLHVVENWLPARDEPGSAYRTATDRAAYWALLRGNVFEDVLARRPARLRRLAFTPDAETVACGDLAAELAELRVRFLAAGLELVVRPAEELRESVVVYPGTEYEYTVKHFKWHQEEYPVLPGDDDENDEEEEGEGQKDGKEASLAKGIGAVEIV